MAPLRTRQVLIWAGLPLTILLSYLWFKKKRTVLQSDPGKKVQKQETKTLEEELKEAESSAEANPSSPSKTFSRSLSGVDTNPIDIVFPKELRAKKPSPIIISDEDLDLEIEKIKSMKSDPYNKKSGNSLNVSPLKASASITSVEPVEEERISSESENSSVKTIIDTSENKENCQQTESENTTTSCSGPQNPESSRTNCCSPINASSSQEGECDQVDSTSEIPKEEEMTKSKRRSKTPQQSKNMTKNCKKVTEDRTVQETTSNIDTELNETTVEKKLSSLHLDTKPRSPKNNHHHPEEYHRTSCERDSANHSPADLMLASPSLSSISDNHSEGSSDSGKGGSDVVTPPPSRTPACDGSVSGDVPLHSIYEFLIPQSLVGRLIGRQGTFVTQIKEKTRAHIVIKKHPDNPKLKVCQIEGTQLEIDTALEMIRDKFPEKRYPELTLEQVSFLPPVSTVPLIPEHLCLKLIEGINNDTIVSCMVAPNHLFLQQPTHPTFPNLLMLSNCLNACYADASSPLLPNPIPENTVCIAQSLGAWYRALVLSTDLENEVSYVKFLDYGGYVNIPNSELRQIRADFLSLPFQASECILANVKPIGGDDAPWLDEAYSLVADLTKGSILYTQVVGFADERIPLVHIYIVLGPQSVVFLNGELVNSGFAEWIPSEDCSSMSNSFADSSTTIRTEDQTLESTA